MFTASDPTTGAFYAADPATGATYAADPSTGVVYAADPSTGATYAADPSTGVMYASDPATGITYAADPTTGAIYGVDPATAANIVDIKLHSGRMTLNEARDEDGLGPVDGGGRHDPRLPGRCAPVVGGPVSPADPSTGATCSRSSTGVCRVRSATGITYAADPTTGAIYGSIRRAAQFGKRLVASAKGDLATVGAL